MVVTSSWVWRDAALGRRIEVQRGRVEEVLESFVSMKTSGCGEGAALGRRIEVVRRHVEEVLVS